MVWLPGLERLLRNCQGEMPVGPPLGPGKGGVLRRNARTEEEVGLEVEAG